jgi:hypothetical protein
MSCGCGKKSGPSTTVLFSSEQLLNPSEWGPILWKYLHCLAEKMGTSGSTIVDTDQANYMEHFLLLLPFVIPCTDCQSHTATYIQNHPIPSLKGLYGVTLQSTVRAWLFSFHDAVRHMKGQPIVIGTVTECTTFYTGCTVLRKDYNTLIQSIAAAIKQGWVRVDHWRKWYSYSERLRILTGNLVS